jgi:hypothetical protein
MVGYAAILVTEEAVFAGLIEAGGGFAHLAGKNHQVDIGPLD